MKLLTAHDFSGRSTYAFGLDVHRSAQTLRDLADAIEKKPGCRKVCLIEVIAYSEAGPEDFTVSTLAIKFGEHPEPETEEGRVHEPKRA